ncbi:MAG: N-6 DNA methylase [archaeon YNP-WB-062]|nr:N-6 DNA methylase [Candidatus Culexarchaeum yellowstonense]
MEKNSKVKMLGQYFTPKFVTEFMVSLITKPKDSLVLEPSAGTGVFLLALYEAGFRNVNAYEIDFNLPNYSPIRIVYQDFLKIEPEKKYDVIIGNPPYVRWRNIPHKWREEFRKSGYWNTIMNGLADLTYAFIYHSVNMLKEGGELIFITPIFWMETVHGARLRNYMIKRGYLELVVNFNEMKIFEEVSSTIVIFKYVKGRASKDVKVKIVNIHTKESLTSQHLKRVKELLQRLNGGETYIRDGIYEAFIHEQPKDGESWRFPPPIALIRNPLLSLQFSPSLHFTRISLLGSIAEIGNGMVSGLDEAFQLKTDISTLTDDEKRHIIHVYKAHTLDKFIPGKKPVSYIYVNDVEGEEEFKEKYPNFYKQLVIYKERLLKRYNYGRDIPWWHWVFPRNKHLFEKYEEKIFVPSKERYDTKGYFRFAYIKGLYYATQDVTVICPKPLFREGVLYLLALLNSAPYQEYIKHKGFTRGGVYDFSEKPLSTIPIIRIDWNSIEERRIYGEIVSLTKDIIVNRVKDSLEEELNDAVFKLLSTVKL